MIKALAAALMFFFGHLHPLEAEHYATVIAEEAWIAGIDRWSERTWVNLEGQAGVAEVHAPMRASNDGPQAGRPTPRRETGWLAGRQRNWLR